MYFAEFTQTEFEPKELLARLSQQRNIADCYGRNLRKSVRSGGLVGDSNISRRDGLRIVALFGKAFLASIVANLPMFALLLVPQLMRSRAGSETLLAIGTVVYLGLITLALLTTPRVTARAAPNEGWLPSTANATVHRIFQTQRGAFWQRIGEWCVLFALAQGAGLLIAWLLPYVSDNPRFGIPGQSRWIVHYRNYFVQAVTVYLFSCFSFAWLGMRFRALARK